MGHQNLRKALDFLFLHGTGDGLEEAHSLVVASSAVGGGGEREEVVVERAADLLSCLGISVAFCDVAFQDAGNESEALASLQLSREGQHFTILGLQVFAQLQQDQHLWPARITLSHQSLPPKESEEGTDLQFLT